MIPEITSITNLGTKPDPKEVAAKVQSMFTEFMLKAMEESVDAEEGLFGNSASSDIYRGMLREHLARALSDKMPTALTVDADRAGAPKAPLQDLPVDGIVSSPEGWRKDPIDGLTRFHAGTDIAAPEGTPIRAVAGGRVIESGNKGDYGNAVVIQTDDGRKMVYAHNSRNFVQSGDAIEAGEIIGEVGSTGRATGPHVHFEVKF